MDVTLTLADHDLGQTNDKFTTTTPVTDVLYAFKLTRFGTVTVTNLRVNFTTGGGVVNGDLSNGQLYVDVNNDGLITGADTLIQTVASPVAGVFTFTTDFSPSATGTNYLVRATVANLVNPDTTTFSVATADIDEVEVGVVESGSISNAVHTQDASTLTLADHDLGQTNDKFLTSTPVTDVLHAFKLTRTGTVTVTNLRVNFTTGGGVVNGDLSNGQLYVDVNNDGLITGADTLIQTVASPAGGVFTFTTNFSPATTGTNYLVRATVNNLVSLDTTTFSLAAADIDEVEAGIVESGSISNALHTMDVTLTLADHDLGQTNDKFTTTTPVTDVLYAFKLTRFGTVNVTNLRVNFTTGGGVVNGDLSNGQLYVDVNNDGLITGADALIQTVASPAGGVFTFTTNFSPSATGTNYLVRATVANLLAPDTTTFSVSAVDIDEVEAGVVESGSISNAVHTQDASTLTLADHDLGQTNDKFLTTTPVTDVLFRFKLTTAGVVTVDNIRVNFSTGGGVANADVTSGELWEDVNGDGAVDGGDIQRQTGVAGSGGQLLFGSDVTPSAAGTNYLVRATVANLAAADTTTFSLGTADIDEVQGGVVESGTTTGAVHTQDSQLILANHDLGQSSDKFTSTTPVTDVLFRFQLTRLGNVNVDVVRVYFSTGGGVANGDVTSGELWFDFNDDGVVDGGDTSIQTGVTPSGGVLTFTNNFAPMGGAGSSLLVRATVASLANGDTTTFSLGTADIDVIETDVLESGSATAAVHTQDSGSADIYYSVGTSAANLMTGSPTIQITAGVADLDTAQLGNVGVGDVIDYDFDNKKIYIKSVVSPTRFVVQLVDGALPGDIGPVTVNSIGRTFNDLTAAEASSGNASFLNTFDLVGGQYRLHWVLYNDGAFSTTADVEVDGYSTDAAHPITITAASASQVVSGVSQRHNGTAGTGARLVAGANLTDLLRIRDHYVTVEWLELDGAADSARTVTTGLHVDGANNAITLRDNLVHDVRQTTGAASGILLNGCGPAVACYVYNNVVYDVESTYAVADQLGRASGIVDVFGAAGSSLFVYNNTVYKVRQTGGGAANSDASGITGFDAADRDVRNNIVIDVSVAGSGVEQDFCIYSGTIPLSSTCHSAPPSNATFDYNLSADLSATGANSITGEDTSEFVDVINGSEDLHLAPTADAIDAGVDLSGAFAHDIDGGARQTPWDLGADDQVATTAVELVAFEARALDGAILLRWETGSEMDNLGFHIYRTTEATGSYAPITTRPIPGLGNSPAGAQYSYRDEGLRNGTTYFYRLEDIETTGRTELHGPVSATPSAAAAEEPEPGTGDDAGGARITYGNPETNALRVLQQSDRELVLELRTDGFYALPQADGSILLDIPGFTLLNENGAPSIPVKHHWVDAYAGRQVELSRVQTGPVEIVTASWLLGTESSDLVASTSGTVRAEHRPRATTLSREGLFPRRTARTVTIAFQGEVKRALLEMAPLRWDGSTRSLLLTRRLTVRISFAADDVREITHDGVRGRRRRRSTESETGGSAAAFRRERPACTAYATNSFSVAATPGAPTTSTSPPCD
jgi:hypothetical protein